MQFLNYILEGLAIEDFGIHISWLLGIFYGSFGIYYNYLCILCCQLAYFPRLGMLHYKNMQPYLDASM
jgi:hypothetical protein